MTCSPRSELEDFAAALSDGLRAELFLTPKPGLVDLCDSGSHPDLSLSGMLQSIRLLRNYLLELCRALQRGDSLPQLVEIGRLAEQRMYRRLGTNCHRGGIFLCGLLLIGRSRCAGNDPQLLSRAVALAAEEFFSLPGRPDSNGRQVRDRFRVGGIVKEALSGLPSLFEIALPALSDCCGAEERGIWLAMARLMQHVEDTTTLHRCGQTGLARLRKAGLQLETALLAGHDPGPLLFQMNRDFRAMKLTMGGVADLLGVALGCHAHLRQALHAQALPAHG